MIVINNVDSQKFSFNGVEYFKNFTPIVVGDKIRILNTYDSSIELTDAPRLFSEFEVNGIVYASASLLQTALLPILYTRATLGGGAVNSVNGETGAVILNANDVSALSNNPSTYPTATTPISNTDQLFVIQGGVVKKVDKSEIGGTGGLVFFKSFLNVSPTAVTTNGVHTYVFSIPIPAETIKTGDVVEIRYSCAKSSGSSSVNANAWLSNSAGAMTQIIQTGFLAGSPSNSKNLYKRSLIFESNTRFFSVISSAESNYSDEVQTAGVRAFTDMSVNLTNDLWLDFSVKNFGAGNFVFMDFAYIKVYRNT